MAGAVGSHQSTDLAYLGGGEALNAFATGALSPVELLEALIERAAPWSYLIGSLA